MDLWMKKSSTDASWCPIVKITWKDATDIETGWHTLTDVLKKTLTSVESVGWLVEESDEKIVLVACWDPTDKCAGRGLLIPKPWIVKKEILTPEEASFRSQENY